MTSFEIHYLHSKCFFFCIHLKLLAAQRLAPSSGLQRHLAFIYIHLPFVVAWVCWCGKNKRLQSGRHSHTPLYHPPIIPTASNVFFCINFMHSNVLCCFPAVLLPPLGKVEEETLWIHFSKKFICVIVFYSHKKNCFAILWKVRDAMVVPRCSSFTCRNCYCITLI